MSEHLIHELFDIIQALKDKHGHEELEHFDRYVSSKNSFMNEHNDLKDSLQELKDNHSQLKKRVVDYLEKMKTMNQKNMEYEKEINELREEISEIQKTSHTFIQQTEDIKKYHNDTLVKNESLKQSMQGKIDELKAIIKTHNDVISKHGLTIRQLTAHNETLIKENKMLNQHKQRFTHRLIREPEISESKNYIPYE